MSVFIRDVVIPDCCDNCYCSGGYGCEVTGTIMTTKEMTSKRPDWCPMVEVKTPHGRLIDADELAETAEFYETVMDIGHHAQTVIEAEGEP